MSDDGGGLAAGSLQHPGEVFIQDGLRILIGGAGEEGQRVWRELGSDCDNLCIFSFFLLDGKTQFFMALVAVRGLHLK